MSIGRGKISRQSMLFRARPSTNRPKISLTSEHHFRFSTALGGDCYDQKIAPAGGGPAEAGLADLGGRRAAETATRD